MTLTVSNCPRCGVELQASERVCPQCGLLVHVRELDALGKRALQTEAQDPAGAIEIWQQCLPLLPPDSAQARMVQDRIAAISGHLARFGWHPPVGPGVLQTDPARVEPVPRDDPWLLAVSKTVGSMIVSIVLYQLLFKNWLFSIGFVLLILVHEMGHVIAMRRWGLRASPPIFIPFLGALINLREPPPNAKVEAIVGIGGPLLGTVGAMACYLTAHWYLDQGNPVGPVLLQLAYFGFLLNLFNMIPVPPLDGGRITAAVSPWIWMPGVLILLGIMVQDYMSYGRINPIMILVLVFALPRLWDTLKNRDRESPYYQISHRASFAIGTLYASLGVVLLMMYYITKNENNAMMWSIGAGL